jgi:hypothetical protein
MRSKVLSHWRVRQMVSNTDRVRLMMVIYDMFHKAEEYRLYAKNIKAKNKCVKIRNLTLAEKAGVTPSKAGNLLPLLLQDMGLRLTEKRKSNRSVTYIICKDEGGEP